MNSLYPLQAAILQADARRIPLQDQSVHCVVTSPPYWGLRDYGMNGQLGLEGTPEEYIENMVAVFREVWRVLRDDGTCWMNMGDCYNAYNHNRGSAAGANKNHHEIMPSADRGLSAQSLKPKDLVGMPWRLAFALQADGWYLRSDIIWAKPNPMPESVTDRPTKSHEYMFLLTKKPRYYYDADAVREDGIKGAAGSRFDIGKTGTRDGGDRAQSGYRNGSGRNLRDVWHIATQPYPAAHFATYPEKLVEPCVKAGTSKKGICSKCGAGWVRVVEREYGFDDSSTRHIAGNDKTIGQGWEGTQRRADVRTTTTGWRPACECNAPTVPAIVFDPFGGSGTTASVALKLGRRAVVMDIGYHGLAKRRVFA